MIELVEYFREAWWFQGLEIDYPVVLLFENRDEVPFLQRLRH